MLPFLAGLLVVWWASRPPARWRQIGFVRPANWASTVALGITFGVAFKLLMKAIVMPLLGADPINQAYQYLAANPAALPGMIFIIIAGAGFGEETFWRGFLFERLTRLLGASAGAKATIVLLTSIVFGLAHYIDQGVPGVQQATIVGLAFGTIYALWGRLFMLMIAHAAFDLTALALIYLDLETEVARSVFG